MSSIQKTLDSLQPYVIGIRYLEGRVVVDVIFKEGWTVPEVQDIKKVKGDEGLNYYMVFSDVANIGLDDLLAHIENIIKINLDREKKHELFKIKVKQLQEVFKKNTLAKLTKLVFTFTDEELVPKLGDMDIDMEQTSGETFVEEEVENNEVAPTAKTNEPVQYLDENKNPIVLTDEDKEILEEEARANRFKAIQEETKKKGEIKNINNKKIELPPKKIIKPQEPVMVGSDCDCGPTEACGKCIGQKDL